LQNLLKIDYNKEKIYISYFYSRILFHLFPQNLNEKKYSLSKFYYSITYFNSIFKENNHNSPIDFLIYFLDRLHVENIQFINFNNHHHFNNLKESSNNQNFSIKSLVYSIMNLVNEFSGNFELLRMSCKILVTLSSIVQLQIYFLQEYLLDKKDLININLKK